MKVGKALQEHWGFDSLRPLQQEATDAAVAGKDAVIVMPTGGGKSLCFQLPPLIDGRLTVVVSPLLSLMKDQVDGLRMVRYQAAALNSHLSIEEELEVSERLVRGEVKLLYLSPERALRPDTVALLQSAHEGHGPVRFAIDEAHCISNWGHDFRPEYRQLSRLREFFPDVSIHALTATAAPLVRDDIAEQLRLRSPEFFIGRFDRENLTYRIVPKVNKLRQIANAVGRHEGEASIVYCISRKDTEMVADGLANYGVQAVAYHAGLDASTRKQISEDFAQERVHVVVATVAFGMGIDRANVRCVVHESMPRSIESYQQETGRAGRDGMPSECLMLYSPADVLRWERLIRQGDNPVHIEHQIALMDEVRRFAVGRVCRHKFLSEYFGQSYEAESCGACDLCIEGWQPAPDSTRVAHKILMTVMDIQRRHGSFFFGAGHIASVLTGSKSKQVLQFKHETLRGHGCLDMTATKAQSFVDQLVDLGHLRRTSGDFPSVALTQQGVDALMGRCEILMRDLVPEQPKSEARRGPLGDRALLEALRAIRREVAAERKVAVDAVMSDAALVNVAKQRPLSASEFALVSGVGEARARDVGHRFVEAVRGFVEGGSKRGSVNTASRLAPHFERGRSVQDVARDEGLAVSTVTGYLAEWVEDTGPASVSVWVDEATYTRVVAQFERLGIQQLKPLFLSMNEEVPYETIRLVRAHWAHKNPIGAEVRELAGAYS